MILKQLPLFFWKRFGIFHSGVSHQCKKMRAIFNVKMPAALVGFEAYRNYGIRGINGLSNCAKIKYPSYSSMFMHAMGHAEIEKRFNTISPFPDEKRRRGLGRDRGRTYWLRGCIGSESCHGSFLKNDSGWGSLVSQSKLRIKYASTNRFRSKENN